MKKTLMILTGAFLLVSCATTTTSKNAHPSLTMDNIEEKCKLDEFYNVSVLGTPSVVIKFVKCMEYKSLLIISIPNTADNKKIRSLVTNLLLAHYLKYMENQNENTRWWAEGIKKVVEKEWSTNYFLLSSEPNKPVE